MISRRERNISLVTGLVLAALLADWMFIRPLLTRRSEASARLEQAQLELAEAQLLFDNDLRARRRWSQLSGHTLEQEAPQAEGQLLNAAREWAQQSEFSLTTLKTERVGIEQGYGTIAVRATGTGGTEELARFLHQVQTSDVPVRVADVTVTSRREGTDDLLVQIGLSTIFLAPEAESTGTSARTGRRP